MLAVDQASPARRIARFKKEIDAAIDQVLAGRQYILGTAVEHFEEAFARFLGVAHCIGVASGTDAIVLALRALGVEPRDEVITVSLTAAATAQAILLCGAQPRFVDVDPVTRCLDPGGIAAAVTAKTAAIIPVHLFGQPADMPRIMSVAETHGLAVVEDCAHAAGATIDGRRVGSFGHAAAFSFYPTKNLGAVGDAGVVGCNDPALADRLRSLRSYGWDANRISHAPAGSSRLDEIQAAILAVLLPHLDNGNEERRRIAGAYRTQFADLGLGLPPDDPGAIFHQFAIEAPDRDALRRYLSNEKIGTAVHYSPPLYQHPAFHQTDALRLPLTEALSSSLLSLPIQPEVAGPHVERIAEAVRKGIVECRRS